MAFVTVTVPLAVLHARGGLTPADLPDLEVVESDDLDAAAYRADPGVLRAAFPILESVTGVVDPDAFAILDLWFATV